MTRKFCGGDVTGPVYSCTPQDSIFLFLEGRREYLIGILGIN